MDSQLTPPTMDQWTKAATTFSTQPTRPKNPKKKQRVRQKRCIRKYPLQKKKALDPRISERFITTLSKQPLPPTSKGCLRFLTFPYPHNNTSLNWFSNRVLSHDRTIPEWCALIDDLRTKAILPPSYDKPLSAEPKSEFFQSRDAANVLEALLEKEIRLRWIAWKFVRRLKIRICARRIIGMEEDLYTLQPIPVRSLVRILDMERRRTYCFHVNTALQTILFGLKYSTYGIAMPQKPKNPYTNLPWNAGQLASLMSQVGSLLWSAQKIVPEELSHFRDVCYDINLFLKENRRSLNISAAIDFLKNKDDEDARSICHELVTDLYNENYDVEKPNGWRSVRALVVARQLPTPMLRKWDAVVIGVWVYQNHGFSLGFKAYEDILEIFQRLHNQTYQWWQSRPVAAPQQVPNASQ